MVWDMSSHMCVRYVTRVEVVLSCASAGRALVLSHKGRQKARPITERWQTMFNITDAALETHVTEFRNVLSETLAPYGVGVDVSEVESNFFYVRDRYENIIARG